jgi:hypothetical protein
MNSHIKQLLIASAGSALLAGVILQLTQLKSIESNNRSQSNISLTQVSDISAATISLQNRLVNFDRVTPEEKNQIVEEAKSRGDAIKKQLESSQNDAVKITEINNQLSIDKTVETLSPEV